MPNDEQDNDGGNVESGVARLPQPTRAPDDLSRAVEIQPPALSDEALKARQDALGTRRKPAGPPLGEGPAADSNARALIEDVPETEVTAAREYDPENPNDDGGTDGSNDPLESSERD